MAGPKRWGTSRGRYTVVRTYGADLFMRFDPGADVVAALLDERAERLGNLQPVMDAFGRYLVEEHIPHQFRVEGTPKRWAALSDEYADYKERHYGNLPILVISGQMKRGFYWVARKRSLQVRNRAPYWYPHQFGGEHLPARPMLQVDSDDHRVLSDLVAEHVQGDD